MTNQQILTKISNQLSVIFPMGKTYFDSVDQLTAYLNELGKGLEENGLFEIEFIQLGFKHARSEGTDFFPSVPTFIKWCMPRPEDYGFMSIDEAWTTATQQAHDPSKLDQLIYTTGYGKWSQIAAGKGEKEFKSAYIQNLIKHKTQNMPLKTPVTALEAKPKQPQTKEAKAAAKAVLDDLMGNL